MSFADLKRNRTDISKMIETATAAVSDNNNQSKDERIWYPQRDKAGNGYAVVRFLPGFDPNQSWVRYWEHAFKGPTGQWYIEKSLTSIGQQDPIAELNNKMWNSGIEADKAVVRQRKRNLRYVANILVISDPSNPENEGQVKLFRFGKKIYDKIMDAMQPQFPDEAPIYPFDMWEGADFVIKVRKVEGYPNYDASSFKAPAALSADDAYLEQIYNKQYDLSEFTDPKNYKTYDELKERLNLVLGETNPQTSLEKVRSAIDLDDSIPNFEERSAPAPEPRSDFTSPHQDRVDQISQGLEESVGVGTRAPVSDDDDDIMAKFAALANDD